MAFVAPAEPVLPVAARRGAAVEAQLSRLVADGPVVGMFRLEGGKHRGAIGPPEGETIQRLIRMSVDAGVPIVGVLATSGADIGDGVSALHAWGGVARALVAASGVVPIALVVTGPCLSGPALLLGIADLVVMTADAFSYVSGPDAVLGFTGVPTTHQGLGGVGVHSTRTGIASLVAEDEDEAMLEVADVLSYFPATNLGHAPVLPVVDPVDRATRMAEATVPTFPTASYDVRNVIDDIVDEHTFLELKARHAPNLVTGLARIGGYPVGIVANQPSQLAGTLDIEGSQKGARFVAWCDAFNLPLVTFVDTPGYQPGKDIEWRGMIRHGAELAHAYAAASVPRLCVLLRKAYGGAYIVMDSKTLGNDLSIAWPRAEIAVMGPAQAVGVLHGRRLAKLPPDEAAAERAALEDEYAAQHCHPNTAAARGYVDDVIDPLDTRRVLAEALVALTDKRDHPVRRRHANTPL